MVKNAMYQIESSAKIPEVVVCHGRGTRNR